MQKENNKLGTRFALEHVTEELNFMQEDGHVHCVVIVVVGGQHGHASFEHVLEDERVVHTHQIR